MSKLQFKSAATTHAVTYPNLSAVPVHNSFAHSQPQARRVTLCTESRFKDAADRLLWNTATRIVHRDDSAHSSLPPHAPHGHRNLASSRSMTDCIADQVQQHLPQLVLAPQNLQFFLAPKRKRHARLFRNRPHKLHTIMNTRGYLDRHQQNAAPTVQAQHIVDCRRQRTNPRPKMRYPQRASAQDPPPANPQTTPCSLTDF